MNSTTPNFLDDLDAAPPVKVSSFLPSEISVIEVKSSLIAAIGYDELSSKLQVNFTDGAVWQYTPVPVWQWTNFQTAKSVGKHFLQNIKDAGYTAIQIKAGNNKPTMIVTPGIDTMSPETPKHVQTLGEKVVEAMSAEPGFLIEGNSKVNLKTGEVTDLEDEVIEDIAMPKIEDLDHTKLFSKGGTAYLVALVELAAKNVPTSINSRYDAAKIRSEAYEIARIKTALDDTKLAYTKQWRDKVKEANDEAKLGEAKLIELHAQVRKPLTDQETAERMRKQAHEDRILDIENAAFTFANANAASIEKVIAETTAIHADWDFKEYTVKAGLVRNERLAALRAQLVTAQTNEKNAQDAADLRKKNEELSQQLRDAQVVTQTREQTLAEVAPKIEALETTVQRQQEIITCYVAPVAAPAPMPAMQAPPVPVVSMERKILVHTEAAEGLRRLELDEAWVVFLMNNIIAGNVPHLEFNYN